MMLHLDDVHECWKIGTVWLRRELNCQRVDTGFGRAEAKDYFPGFCEAKNGEYDVPSFGGFAVNNRDPIMQAMWSGNRPVIFADIKEDRRVTPVLRKRMSGAKTKSKFGAALRTRGGSYGLICADWAEHLVPNESLLFDCFEQTVQDVLSPIIAVAKQISDTQAALPAAQHDAVSVFQYGRRGSGALDALTNAEIEVARLVAQGHSYKEIARIRGRSLSTIDHQLRSIRSKMGVTSTSNLISLLAGMDGFAN
ncbi:MAG: helix-turn-helix transcriptional regulator [Pseudomonadota bacterium]